MKASSKNVKNTRNALEMYKKKRTKHKEYYKSMKEFSLWMEGEKK